MILALQNKFRRQCDAVLTRSVHFLRTLVQRESQLPARNRESKNLARSENGESLVAFALTAPIMFGFVFGIMQICLAFYTYEWISECAREGTRYAIVHGSTCTSAGGASCTVTASGVNSFVLAIGLPNLGGGKMNVVTTYPDGDEVPPHRVQVNVTYVFPYNIPFVTAQSLSMSSTSEMYILQ